jgi:hypothetical protein
MGVVFRAGDTGLQRTVAPKKSALQKRPTADPEAYNLYLKGRYFVARRGWLSGVARPAGRGDRGHGGRLAPGWG